MEYNERLMNESLQGNKDSLEELNSNACSGSAEAQYYLAMYYSKSKGGEQNPDYQYWMEKAVKNGYSSPLDNTGTIIQEQTKEEEQISFFTRLTNHDISFYFGFLGRVNRSFFILATILYFVLYVSAMVLFSEMYQNNPQEVWVFLHSLISLVLWYIWYAQAVKRIHDINHSGWWLLLPFVIIWVFFAEGDKENNDYGEPM